MILKIVLILFITKFIMFDLLKSFGSLKFFMLWIFICYNGDQEIWYYKVLQFFFLNILKIFIKYVYNIDKWFKNRKMKEYVSLPWIKLD